MNVKARELLTASRRKETVTFSRCFGYLIFSVVTLLNVCHVCSNTFNTGPVYDSTIVLVVFLVFLVFHSLGICVQHFYPLFLDYALIFTQEVCSCLLWISIAQ